MSSRPLAHNSQINGIKSVPAGSREVVGVIGSDRVDQ
jgi:hypothetical protein